MATCIVQGCDSDAMVRSEHGLCATCYAGMYYWKNKTPTQILRRRRQLYRLQGRMEMMTPNVKHLDQVKRKK
jgi:hypothetical protein